MWAYDTGGNITSRTEYNYTAGDLGEPISTDYYTYDDDSWGDLLTAYNGAAITYDGIGNPLNDGTWTYSWSGRQLESMSGNGTTWNYKYDSDGLRTERSNGSTTYGYVYSGDSLIHMSVGSNLLYFTYEGSKPTTVTYNGTKYYYVTNLQGDVVAILDGSGNPVVQYVYDTWGKPLSTSGTLANTLGQHNPLRYRGYIYDPELGLYYLQSRYYNPAIGRFINADSYASTGQGIIGNNMFAYCGNNPVANVDTGGNRYEAYDADILSGYASIATAVALRPAFDAIAQATATAVNQTITAICDLIKETATNIKQAYESRTVSKNIGDIDDFQKTVEIPRNRYLPLHAPLFSS